MAAAVSCSEDRRWWRDDEIETLITIITELKVVKTLDGKRQRNSAVFRKVVNCLNARGIFKSLEQVRTKWKGLKRDYFIHLKNNVEKDSLRPPKFYEQMDFLMKSCSDPSFNCTQWTTAAFPPGENYAQLRAACQDTHEEKSPTGTFFSSDEEVLANCITSTNAIPVHEELVIEKSEDPEEIPSDDSAYTSSLSEPRDKVCRKRKWSSDNFERIVRVYHQLQSESQEREREFWMKMLEKEREVAREERRKQAEESHRLMKIFTDALLQLRAPSTSGCGSCLCSRLHPKKQK